MKKFFLSLSTLSLAFFTGCSSNLTVPTTPMPKSQGAFYNKSYKLNKTYTISVGDELLQISGTKNGEVIIVPVLTSEQNISMEFEKDKKRSFSINKNEKIYVYKEITIDNQVYYAIPIPSEYRNMYMIPTSRSSDIVLVFFVNKNSLEISKYYGHFFFSKYSKNQLDIYPKELKILSNQISLKKLENEYIVSTHNQSSNFDIVYNGISNNTLRFTYREFSPDDLAKPAFYQDLTFNKNDKFIKIKGIEIEILKLSSSELTYKIIKENIK